MVYVVAEYTGKHGQYKCISICSTVQEARAASVRYVGSSYKKEAEIFKFTIVGIKHMDIMKGKIFQSTAPYYAQLFMPKIPKKHVLYTWSDRQYFVDSKGNIIGKAADDYGRPHYILAKCQETI